MFSVENQNKTAFEYHNQVFGEFKEICAPIYGIGIDNFGYMKIFPDGTYLSLMDYPEYQKHYFSSIKKNSTVFLESVDERLLNKRLGFASLDTSRITRDSTRSNSDTIIHLLDDYGVSRIFSFYKINKDYIEWFSFCLNKSSSSNPQFFLNNSFLLEEFIRYFNYKSIHLRDTKNKKKLGIFEQNYQLNMQSAEDKLSQNITNFLQQIHFTDCGMKDFNGDQVKLSHREIECLEYLALGYSVKEIASNINLSPRTVESYIEHSKHKTGFHFKSDLIKNFIKQKWYEKLGIQAIPSLLIKR